MIQLLACFNTKVLVAFNVSKVVIGRNIECALTEMSTSSSWMANGLPSVMETNLDVVMSVLNRNCKDPIDRGNSPVHHIY